jgi:putative oxidoreductase
MGPEAGFTRLRTVHAGILRALDRLAFLAPLATRVVIGMTFMQTGWGKLHHFPRTVAFFSSLGIPFPAANAGFVSGLELVGGALLIAGIGTRAFAAALSGSMVVALLTADRQAFVASWGAASDSTPTDVTSFTFLLFLLWLVFMGPGRASLDHLIARAAARRGAGAARALETGAAAPAKRG